MPARGVGGNRVLGRRRVARDGGRGVGVAPTAAGGSKYATRAGGKRGAYDGGWKKEATAACGRGRPATTPGSGTPAAMGVVGGWIGIWEMLEVRRRGGLFFGG